jgi:AcrR family transcriptional regulator
MDRREEILIAAQHSFLRYGISKLTLADIAHECGIRKTALYYYFKSKEDLLSEMICRKIDEYETMIRASISNSEGVQEKLRIYMKTKIEFMEKNTAFMKLFEKEGLPVKARQKLMHYRSRLMEADFCLVESIIEQGIKNRKVSYKLNDSLVLMIMGVTYGSFLGRYLENKDWDIDEMIDTTIEVIFMGIK